MLNRAAHPRDREAADAVGGAESEVDAGVVRGEVTAAAFREPRQFAAVHFERQRRTDDVAVILAVECQFQPVAVARCDVPQHRDGVVLMADNYVRSAVVIEVGDG